MLHLTTQIVMLQHRWTQGFDEDVITCVTYNPAILLVTCMRRAPSERFSGAGGRKINTFLENLSDEGNPAFLYPIKRKLDGKL